MTLALSLDKQMLSGRPLRVQRSTEKTKPAQEKTTKRLNSTTVKRDGTPKVSFNKSYYCNDLIWKVSVNIIGMFVQFAKVM